MLPSCLPKHTLKIPRQLNLELPNLEAYVEHFFENVKNILVKKHMENYELRHQRDFCLHLCQKPLEDGTFN